MLSRNFNSEFKKRRGRFKFMFRTISTFIAIIFIAQLLFFGFIANEGYEAYQESNGSIGTMMGSIYKDFKEATGE